MVTEKRKTGLEEGNLSAEKREKRASTGNAALDRLLEDDFSRNSVILLAGSSSSCLAH